MTDETVPDPGKGSPIPSGSPNTTPMSITIRRQPRPRVRRPRPYRVALPRSPARPLARSAGRPAHTGHVPDRVSAGAPAPASALADAQPPWPDGAAPPGHGRRLCRSYRSCRMAGGGAAAEAGSTAKKSHDPKSRKAARMGGLSIVKPRSNSDHDTTSYRSWVPPEAKTLVSTIVDRGLEQLDTGPPPFCC